MRGKQTQDNPGGLTDRITPADAGKTDREGYFFMTEEDHPRGCGENKGEAAMILNRVGSPPRMRGKLE